LADGGGWAALIFFFFSGNVSFFFVVCRVKVCNDRPHFEEGIIMNHPLSHHRLYRVPRTVRRGIALLLVAAMVFANVVVSAQSTTIPAADDENFNGGQTNQAGSAAAQTSATAAPATTAAPAATAAPATTAAPAASNLQNITQSISRVVQVIQGILGILAQILQALFGVNIGTTGPGTTGTGTTGTGNTGTNTTTTPGGTTTAGGVGSLPPLERPHGRAEIERVFGARGTNQVTTSMAAGPGGRMVSVTCHRLIAPRLQAVFAEIRAQGLSQHIRTFDGCFNNRNKRGGSTPSTHAWGIAVDLNASQNPMGSSNMTAGQRQLATIFQRYGFYQLPNDPMHFQFCTGY
jgi:hypothetical protein